jgi:hypothetical protein
LKLAYEELNKNPYLQMEIIKSTTRWLKRPSRLVVRSHELSNFDFHRTHEEEQGINSASFFFTF